MKDGGGCQRSGRLGGRGMTVLVRGVGCSWSTLLLRVTLRLILSNNIMGQLGINTSVHHVSHLMRRFMSIQHLQSRKSSSTVSSRCDPLHTVCMALGEYSQVGFGSTVDWDSSELGPHA